MEVSVGHCANKKNVPLNTKMVPRKAPGNTELEMKPSVEMQKLHLYSFGLVSETTVLVCDAKGGDPHNK